MDNSGLSVSLFHLRKVIYASQRSLCLPSLHHLISHSCKVKITYLHFTDRKKKKKVPFGGTEDHSMLGRAQSKTRPLPTVRARLCPPWRVHLPGLPVRGLGASKPGPVKTLQCVEPWNPCRNLNCQGMPGSDPGGKKAVPRLPLPAALPSPTSPFPAALPSPSLPEKGTATLSC